MSRYPSSDYITWGIPKNHVADCILWAQAHLHLLNEHGVEEVTVGKSSYALAIRLDLLRIFIVLIFISFFRSSQPIQQKM